METQELGWHASNLFAYHVDSEGEAHYFLDRKDPGFKAPFFDGGLNAPGGNYQRGIHNFTSPDDITAAEIAEEFYAQAEPDEDLGFAFKGHVDPKETGDMRTEEEQREISQIVPILLDGIQYLGTTLTNFNVPEIGLQEPAMATSLYSKELSAEEYGVISEIVAKYGGKLSTDSVKWGGENIFVSSEDLYREKFAYDCANKFETLIVRGKIPLIEQGNSDLPRTKGIKVIEFIDPSMSLDDVLTTDLGTPTFEGFESLGYRYRVHTPKE